MIPPWGDALQLNNVYAGMQDELTNRINGLEDNIAEMKDKLELSRIALDETNKVQCMAWHHRDGRHASYAS